MRGVAEAPMGVQDAPVIDGGEGGGIHPQLVTQGGEHGVGHLPRVGRGGERARHRLHPLGCLGRHPPPALVAGLGPGLPQLQVPLACGDGRSTLPPTRWPPRSGRGAHGSAGRTGAVGCSTPRPGSWPAARPARCGGGRRRRRPRTGQWPRSRSDRTCQRRSRRPRRRLTPIRRQRRWRPSRRDRTAAVGRLAGLRRSGDPSRLSPPSTEWSRVVVTANAIAWPGLGSPSSMAECLDPEPSWKRLEGFDCSPIGAIGHRGQSLLQRVLRGASSEDEDGWSRISGLKSDRTAASRSSP